MKKTFVLLAIFVSIAFEGIYAQSDPQGSLTAGEKTEYVSTEPYKEFQFFYNHYKHLNISLNGAVKSVVQTEVPVSLLKKDNSLENVYVQQQTWKFSPTGHLSLCHINKTFIKPITDYDFNDSALFDDKYDFTDTIVYYSFDSIGRMCQTINKNYNSKDSFEYDKNGHLIKVVTYYWDKNVLIEKMITINGDGKPVRMEEKGNWNGVESTRGIDAYCYDERGNKVAHQMNNGRSVRWMDGFVYDSLDNMIFKGRCEGYHGNNNSCKCKRFRKNEGYEYDDQHNMLRKYSIGNWKPGGWDNYYQYDSAGREIEYKYYDVRGPQRTFDCQVQTTYDSAGRIVRKEALSGSFRFNEALFWKAILDEWSMVKAVLEEWSYDEHGNLVELVGYQAKDKLFMIVHYQYEYDQQGNWVKRVCYEGVSRDSMMVTEIMDRKIEYYD